MGRLVVHRAKKSLLSRDLTHHCIIERTLYLQMAFCCIRLTGLTAATLYIKESKRNTREGRVWHHGMEGGRNEEGAVVQISKHSHQ